MTQGNLLKEFHKLLKNVDKMSNGQARVTDWDDCNVADFELEIKPNGGPYKGGSFNFKVNLDDDFPTCPPTVFCETHIYHPNIDPTESDGTNICLNMFESSEWNAAYGMDGVIQGLLFLFYEPNVEDPLSPYFDSTIEWDEYEENVRSSLKGEIVEGVQYQWNLEGTREDYEDPETGKNDNSDSSENVPKGDNSPTTDDEVNEVVENVCNTDNNAQGVTNEDSGNNQEPQKPAAKKDFTQENENAAEPDLLKFTNEEASCVCPDVVAACNLQRSESMPGGSKLAMQNKLSNLHDNCKNESNVSLRYYDSLLPEMDLVFAVLNKVTRSIKT